MKPYRPRKSKQYSAGSSAPRTVAKIRRTKTQAYGTPEQWAVQSATCISLAGHRCSSCGTTSEPDNKLRAHHVIAVSMGGTTVQARLRCLCDRCHARQPHHQHLRK